MSLENKKECPKTAATVQSTSELIQLHNTTSDSERQEGKSLDQKMHECYESIYADIYYAERLLDGFNEHHFAMRPENFKEDGMAQNEFMENYEYMAAQISVISNMLFNIRLKTEFVFGDETSPIIKAHIQQENEMRSWLGTSRIDRKG